MTNTLQDYVTIQGIDLDYDESTYATCPECGRENKFSITRTSTGLLYNCFRDACDTAGHVSADGVAMAPRKHKDKGGRKLHVYEGELRTLKFYERAMFLAQYGLTRRALERGRFKYAPEEGCYAFPIITPAGYERGIVLRRYDGREPKALTRQHTAGPTTAWYACHTGKGFRRVVIVEDQISALKLSRYCTTVALLGTAMSHEAAQEIAGIRPEHVTIALDEDAINTAYKLKDWFGLLFSSTDVLHLKYDVKDMPYHEIREKFGC